MSDKRYLGNIITQNPTAPAGPYEDGAASGVWSLAEANAYSAAGLWPIAGKSQRGVFAGGYTGSASNVIQYISIASTGNATDFGDLSAAKSLNSTMASSTRGVIGLDGTNTLEYITIATTGNTTDFGDKSVSSGAASGSVSYTHLRAHET